MLSLKDSWRRKTTECAARMSMDLDSAALARLHARLSAEVCQADRGLHCYVGWKLIK